MSNDKLSLFTNKSGHLSGRSFDCVGPLDLDSVLKQKGADGGLAGQGREVKRRVVVLVVSAVDIGTLKSHR